MPGEEYFVTSPEEDEDTGVQLGAIKRLIRVPGDPTPAKLVLMADLDGDTTVILAEGMSNAHDFRAMIPRLLELKPDLQLDPPDMEEQLRQALNNHWAVTLTCYGTIILICIVLYLLYLLVVYIGMHH